MKYAFLILFAIAVCAQANGPYPVAGGTSGTNFAGILVTNTAYAANFVATGTGTNVFDVTLFTNGVNAYVSSIDTNTAQINGGLTNLVLNTIYTNANQRALLVGSIYAICAATLDAGAVIYYTNNFIIISIDTLTYT